MLDDVPCFVKEYASFGSNIDLIAAGPNKQPACKIVVVTAGSGALSIECATSAGGDHTADLTACAAGEEIEVQATQINASGTSVSKVRVYWML